MKMTLKKLSFLITVFALILSLSISAFAAGRVSYNGNSKKFIFEPGSEYSPTDLFDSFKGVMPGDTLTQQVMIENDPTNNVKIKLYMRAVDTGLEESEKFLDNLKLAVKQDGNSVLFEAPASEEAQLSDWVYLGTVFSGGLITLDLSLEVSSELGNEFQDAIGYVDWEFKVEELPVEEGDPKPPQTGDTTDYIAYIIIASVSAAVIAVISIILFKRKKTEESI